MPEQYEFTSVPMSSTALADHGRDGWMIKAVHAGIVFLERKLMPPPMPEAPATPPAPEPVPEPAPAPTTLALEEPAATVEPAAVE